ncbi:MAG TPA: NAD(P)H-dependent oxidoreductase [Chitinophagaceae bacterium]|nr:NAD(P)H-dependent oxidoreductase [Chitinophagaceae bacterium]
MKIEILSGSPRRNSVTYRVALHLQKALQEKPDTEAGIIDLREHFLPPLQEVFMAPHLAPEKHQALAKRMFEADAFVLLTPEYNGSYTPDLKNLLDHFPKQSRKVFAIATASPGALGGIRAAMQLQQLVFALFGIGSPYMLVTPQVDKKFDGEGNLLDAGFRKSIDVFVNEFLWLAEKVVDEKVAV